MKKLLSLLLSMTMIMGIIIMPAQAEGTGEVTDVYEITTNGINSSATYITNQLKTTHEGGGVGYGFEWYIIPMLRAGKTIDSDILDEYYKSVENKVKEWNSNVKPTDAARVSLALTIMGKDITDIDGVNLAELIYNSTRLSDGSNELAYALLALDAADVEIPTTAEWSRDAIIAEIIKFQLTDGGFSLYSDDETADVDMTAICLQALAPYQDKDGVKTAIENGISYLKNTISAEFDYLDNSNTTAQVLLALASLKIDVTVADNGFGDSNSNIITALEGYCDTDSGGYNYEDTVNSMSTVQVMQAYDAYEKAHKQNLSYWDFTVTGTPATQSPTTETPATTTPEVATAEPVDMYVTIADNGTIVTDKNGGYMAQAPVTVTDRNADSMLTVDEALYAAHETYYEGGAEAGYSTFTGTFGLSLAKLWGEGEDGVTAAAGYYLNNASCWSLADEVHEGDYLTAFNYNDPVMWSDKYSHFTENSTTGESGDTITLTLKHISGYDSVTYDPIFTPYSGAKVVFLGNDSFEELATDENGQVKIKLPTTLEDGNYYVMAYTDAGDIVPAVCKIVVETSNTGTSGGGGSRKITVYIRVADPEGDTFMSKRAYSVDKGASALDILLKTGLDVETTKSVYGEYVSSIEGLAEFDEGNESGWTYRVNGEMPDYSASSYTLESGDYVEWLYTRGNQSDENGSDNTTPVATEKPKETDEPTITDELKFNDVSKGDWFYDSVYYVYHNDLMDGTGENFEPETVMNRAMLVTVLYRLDGESDVTGESTFADIKDGEWYYDAVLWAKETGIVDGITDTEFAPYGEITREQMALIFYRYCEYKGYDVSTMSDLSEFNDANTTSDWAMTAVKWANGIGLINGTSDSTLSPKDSATRAQVATIFMRFCENIVMNEIN